MRFVPLLLLLPACATSWSDADTQANTIGARSEERILEMCSGDAGECTPSRVRSFALLSFCANVRELVVHGAPLPVDGGAALLCRP